MGRKEKSFCSNNPFEGRYTNYFKVGFNLYEFVFDFGQCYEDEEERETIHTRIITSPAYAKRLVELLTEAVVKHETQYGAIEGE